MPLRHLEIMINSGRDSGWICQQLADLLHCFIGDFSIHGHKIQTEVFNVVDEDGVAVYERELPEKDRFEEGVAKTFIQAGVGDKVG